MNWHTISLRDALWLGAVALVACTAAASMTVAGMLAVRQWLKQRGKQ